MRYGIVPGLIILSLIGLAGCAAAAPEATPAVMRSVGIATLTPGAAAATLADVVPSDPSLVRRTGRPQVVEFFAYWCTDCRRMYPVMRELHEEYGHLVDFLYINIDAAETKALQQELTFSGLRPTIVFLDEKGQEVRRLVGVHSEDTLRIILDDLVAVG